jgi:hypothetical protein
LHHLDELQTTIINLVVLFPILGSKLNVGEVVPVKPSCSKATVLGHLLGKKYLYPKSFVKGL